MLIISFSCCLFVSLSLYTHKCIHIYTPQFVPLTGYVHMCVFMFVFVLVVFAWTVMSFVFVHRHPFLHKYVRYKCNLQNSYLFLCFPFVLNVSLYYLNVCFGVSMLLFVYVVIWAICLFSLCVCVCVYVCLSRCCWGRSHLD